MKAPDKIYIQRYSYGALLDGYSETPKKMAEGENIEYIRKDALLMYLKGSMAICLRGSHTRDVLQSIIDKINSL